MSIRKKHTKRCYTIVEVLMAMGVFLVMMTIMMQFFTSAQEVWNASSKRNMLYADARVSMNLMTRELQSMLYRNNDTDGSGIYPFWYEWTEIDENIDTGAGETVSDELRDHFADNDDLPEKTDGTSYLTAINFISTTDLKPVDVGSDVCEIRYRFIPVYFTTATPDSVNNVKGGKLQRACTAETAVAPYNFASFPYLLSTDPSYDAQRVLKIWANASSAGFDTVIGGVYSMNFTCYKWDSGALNYHQPLHYNDYGIDGEDKDNTTLAPALDYNLAMGTPAPVAIRIDMKLLPPKDLKKLAFAIHVYGWNKAGKIPKFSDSDEKEAEQTIQVLKNKIRTFSKVIYLGKLED